MFGEMCIFFTITNLKLTQLTTLIFICLFSHLFKIKNNQTQNKRVPTDIQTQTVAIPTVPLYQNVRLYLNRPLETVHGQLRDGQILYTVQSGLVVYRT